MSEGQHNSLAANASHGAGDSLWQACIDQLAQELPEQQFNTWIKPLVAQVSDDLSKVTIFVANRFKLDWVRAQYSGRIASLLEKLYGQPVQLELALALREASCQDLLHARVHAEMGPAPEPAEISDDSANAAFKNRLNTALTFDTLVEGTANRMARAAAMHVSGMPGQLYNPLFIYGGVGLGKTHLMHAVGNKLLADRPGSKVLYIHAEQFVSDVVKAYQRKTFDEFKERYHSLDLLLIDDVQFFANKDRTQEEFFNAFEALLAKKSHIVMTSDTYPKGLADIHERLVSRFDSGPDGGHRAARARDARGHPDQQGPRRKRRNARGSGLLRGQERALQRARARRGAAQDPGLFALQPEGNLDPAGAGSPARPAVDPEPADLAWRTSRRRWPTTTRSRSPTCIPRSGRPRSPGRARSRCTWPRS